MIRLFDYLRPYRVSILGVLVLTFLQAVSSLYLPKLMADIVDFGVVRGRYWYIWAMGGIMLGVTLASGVFAVLSGFYASRASAGFGKILRRRIFSHVEQFSLQEFDQLGPSSLIVRATNDVMQVQQTVNMLLRMMILAPLTAIGGIVMAVSTNAGLSVILLAVIPVLALLIYAILRSGLGLFRVMQSKVDVVSQVLRENLTGIRVIRAFDRSKHEVERFSRVNREVTDTSIRVYQTMAFLMPAVGFIMNASTLAIVWFGGVRINQGTLQIGNVMAFIQYMMQIMFSVMMVSMMAFMLPRGQASAHRIHEVLALSPQVVDGRPNGPEPAPEGRIEFRHVTFYYPGAEAPALSDVSFVIAPGQKIAIVGGTGSGKSTLIHLILRLYDATSGSVLVDGVDVRDISQATLRARTGYVPQRPVIFSGTLKENIGYGREGATDQDIRRAAEVAQATEFVDTLSQGFDTQVAQGGANLSGGQKQRIAMSRALVRRATIYLLDDSFSALDYSTEARVRLALRKETAHATVIYVAGRVSTAMDADRIIVLDQGIVQGMGTHGELMQSCAVYRDMVGTQIPSEEIG